MNSKRTIHNPASFIGKRIDSTKWIIPDGYWRCEMTGKLYAEADLINYSFAHYFFSRHFLIANGIYCEAAAWLSEEGYDIIMGKLDNLGVLDAYYAAWDHYDDIINGRCEIDATGLVWSIPPSADVFLMAA